MLHLTCIYTDPLKLPLELENILDSVAIRNIKGK